MSKQEFATPNLKRQAPLDAKERRGDDLIAALGSSSRKRQRVPMTPVAPHFMPARPLKRPVQPMFIKAEEKPVVAPVEESDQDEDIDISHIVANETPLRAKAPVEMVTPTPRRDLPSSPVYAPVNEDTSSLLSPNPSSDQGWQEYEQNIVDFGYNDASAPSERLQNGEELEFFYTDFGTSAHGEIIMLYGRTQHNSGSNETVCVLVENLYRALYYLPKDGFSAQDVLAELAPQYKRVGVECSIVTKKYCFGKVNNMAVPAETEYVQANVPFKASSIINRISCRTWRHVFGTSADIFERFSLIHNVKGPGWIKVKNIRSLPDNTTGCAHTYSVDQQDVQVVPGNKPPLNANLMSLSIRTHYNSVKKVNEIVAISMRVFQQISLETTEPAQNLPSQVFTGVRPLDGVFPMGFKKKINEQELKSVDTVGSEKQLLNWFLAKVKKYDPDVLLGHGLKDVDLAVLFKRFDNLQIQNWHFLGRRGVRDNMPRFDKLYSSGDVVPGRLLCDLNGEMARSVASQCSEFTLSEMSKLLLDHERVEMPIAQDSDLSLLKALRNNELDTMLCARIALQLQVLFLSRTLTNISGNSWSRTLDGSRSNRNEFILLHEFTADNYICPDKLQRAGKGKRTKAKYDGGKVLDPKRGIHDNVLVMDFNSLYPSLIQEYNICFSTVNLSDLPEDFNPLDTNQLPSYPASDVPMGIFPRLVKNLVDRRREVKRQMKSPNLSKTTLLQYDIRQTALKLTANSMYGCLGAGDTRFVAIPLAAMTTLKGRQVLEATQMLAEKEGYNVVYGDTDSIMITTGAAEYDDAIKIGTSFKQKVNKNYRMVELDIDNVFTKMMLLNKKKYAALVASKVDGQVKSKLQVKGLDMVRRERPAIVTDVSNKLLDTLFAAEDLDEASEQMREYLTDLHQKTMANEVPLGKFVIRKMLGKDPADYNPNDQKSQEHVALALRRIKNGDIVRQGDVVSFVIVEGEEPQADRARTIADFKRNKYSLDLQYYISKQIWAAVDHIIEPLKEQMDFVGLAKCLEIHVSAKKLTAPSRGSEAVWQSFETAVPAEERFKDCEPLKLSCQCGAFTYRGMESLTARGVECPSCHTVVEEFLLSLQLRKQIVQHIERYYRGLTECSECNLQTRQLTVMGRNCLANNGRCPGRVHHVYDSRALYAQLSYFKHMFSLEGDSETHKVLAAQNIGRFDSVLEMVQRYLDTNGRRTVNMASLFG